MAKAHQGTVVTDNKNRRLGIKTETRVMIGRGEQKDEKRIMEICGNDINCIEQGVINIKFLWDL
jgi:hypothetical protein